MYRLRMGLLTTLVVMASSSALAGPAADHPPPFFVTKIVVGPAHEEAPALYAVGRLMNCNRACERLLVSNDGGRSWTVRRPDSWAGAPIFAVRTGGRSLILSNSGHHVSYSGDEGRTFTRSEISADSVLDARSSRGSAFLLTALGNKIRVHEWGEDTAATLRGLTLSPAGALLHPSYPHVPADQTHAFVFGIDQTSGLAALQSCNHALVCSPPRYLAIGADFPMLHLSPNFGRDGTAFVTTTQGELLRSDDGAASFTPVIISEASRDQLIMTPQGIAFRAGKVKDGPAQVFVATLGVRGRDGGKGSTFGGVFRSIDGGERWTGLGTSPLLGRGATAVAVSPDGRLLASYIHLNGGKAGVLCAISSTDWSEWRRRCPSHAVSKTTPGKYVAAGGSASPTRVRRQASDRDQPVGHTRRAPNLHIEPVTTGRDRPLPQIRLTRGAMLSVFVAGVLVSAAAWRRRRRLS